jgi:hypothetical protein
MSRTVYYEGVIGMEVTDRSSEQTPAKLAQRVEAARQLWPEAELDEFEIVGHAWRPVLIRRSDGVQFRVFDHDPFMQQDPAAAGVACWLVDGGGQLVFLRHRDAPDPAVSQSLPGRFYAGRVEQAPGGQLEVVDEKTGARTKLATGALR